jgi:hypothetical protein
MKKNNWMVAGISVVLLSTILFLGLRWWSNRASPNRAQLLALMPGNARAILYADLSELRQAPFVAQLLSWAPKPQADADYAQFVRDTGFDYERDLDRIAIASYKESQRSTLLAVATGRFDKKKIVNYAQQHGKTVVAAENNKVFVVPMTDSTSTLFFTFLRDDEIIITDDESGSDKFRELTRPDNRRPEWQPRFDRLAGSPVFAVIQQDAATGDALAAQAPGGLRSPQLSALLNQLQWITIAGVPAGATLRVVTECESSSDASARQLADMLNGVIILAQAGLNDPKTRQQLAPELRQAYLDLLNGAEITRIDRNQTKSVRIVFDITPKFLDAAKSAPPQPATTPSVRTQPSRKGAMRH